MLVLGGEGETGVPGEKPLEVELRTNKLSPLMAPGPGIEPRPHWLKARALTTALSLLLVRQKRNQIFNLFTTFEFRSYVPVKSKLQHPPRATPRAFEFLENFWKIPPSRGRKAVRMPHHRSIPGDQMPPPPGNVSAAFIMLRKLCM